MAQILIHFDPRPAPGQRHFYVALASDEDATPREHERHHRQLIGKLFPGIDLEGGNPRIDIERQQVQGQSMLSGDDCNDYQVIDLG
jgi:hypothetical protein